MKRLIVSGLALALLTGGAFAQAASQAPAGTAPAPLGMKAPPPPASGAPGATTPDAPPPPPPGGPRADGRPPLPPGPGGLDDGPGGPPPPPPPPSRAAHFHVERGGTTLDVKCPDDETMKACADFTLQLLDKIQAMPSDPAVKP